MTRIATLATAATLLAASAQFAAAEKASAFIAPTFGQQVEVDAARVYSPKELSQHGLKAGDQVTVTKVPAGPADVSRSSKG